MSSRLIDLRGNERTDYSFRPLASKHRIHELDLTSDDELIALLDTYPRERPQAFTMGTDRCRRDDWHCVDATAASGKEIFAVVRRGRSISCGSTWSIAATGTWFDSSRAISRSSARVWVFCRSTSKPG
jgi:hypothetical protein